MRSLLCRSGSGLICLDCITVSLLREQFSGKAFGQQFDELTHALRVRRTELDADFSFGLCQRDYLKKQKTLGVGPARIDAPRVSAKAFRPVNFSGTSVPFPCPAMYEFPPKANWVADR